MPGDLLGAIIRWIFNGFKGRLWDYYEQVDLFRNYLVALVFAIVFLLILSVFI
jgi:hypothetical protein